MTIGTSFTLICKVICSTEIKMYGAIIATNGPEQVVLGEIRVPERNPLVLTEIYYKLKAARRVMQLVQSGRFGKLL